MPTINKTIWPRGGHSFTDNDRVTFRAPSWDSLYVAVKAYRQRNGFPPGDPEAEIAAQVCKKYPATCREGDLPVHKSNRKPEPPPEPRAQVIQWLSRLRKAKQAEGELRTRDNAEAARRIGICRACPQRTILTNGCSVCGNAVKIIRSSILGSPPLDPDLGACLVLNCDLSVAVHLDEVAVSHPALPEGCWRKVSA